MVAGQALDLEAESRAVKGNELEMIHHLKTGALIRASASCGARIAGVLAPDLAAIDHYATSLGLLFQITDDLLDVTATATDLGKTPGKDERSSKATFPSLYGIESTRDRIEVSYRTASEALSSIRGDTQLLRSIADFIRKRHA